MIWDVEVNALKEHLMTAHELWHYIVLYQLTKGEVIVHVSHIYEHTNPSEIA